jgi:hypothetical protein
MNHWRMLQVLGLLLILIGGSACGGAAPAPRPAGPGEAVPVALKGDAEKGKQLYLTRALRATGRTQKVCRGWDRI